jgi:cell division protein FtsN
MKKNSSPAPKSLSFNQIVTRAIIALAILLLVAGLAFLVTDVYFPSPSPEPAGQSNASPQAPAGSRNKHEKTEIPSDDVNLTFYDRLSKKNTYSSTSPSAPASESQKKPLPAPVQEKKVEVAPSDSSTSPERTERQDDPIYYSVQVGSFQDLEAARRLLNTLKRKGFSPSIITPVHFPDGATWYRVRVGNSLLRSDAERLAQGIKKIGEFKPLVVSVK